jgi:hypothetical protein
MSPTPLLNPLLSILGIYIPLIPSPLLFPVMARRRRVVHLVGTHMGGSLLPTQLARFHLRDLHLLHIGVVEDLDHLRSSLIPKVLSALL